MFRVSVHIIPATTSTASMPVSRVQIPSPPPTYNGGNKLSDTTSGQVQLEKDRLSSQSKEGLGRIKDEGLGEKGTAAPTYAAVVREDPQAQQRLNLVFIQAQIVAGKPLVELSPVVISAGVPAWVVSGARLYGSKLGKMATRKKKNFQVSGKPPDLSNKKA